MYPYPPSHPIFIFLQFKFLFSFLHGIDHSVWTEWVWSLNIVIIVLTMSNLLILCLSFWGLIMDLNVG